MKSPILAVAALALATVPAWSADLARAPAPAPIASPAYNWSGFYAGLHAGYVTADAVVTDTNGGVNPGPFDYSPNGGFGGGTFGYNWQVSPSFLIGVEGDIGFMGLNGKGIIQSASATSHQDLTLDSGVYGDITGRIGFTVGPALIYGKGGWAWFNGEAAQTTTNPGYVTTGTGSWSGWTAGAGIEYMLASNVSVKVEYQHFDFGTGDGYQTNVGDLSSPIGYRFLNETTLKMDSVKAGLNYHF